MYKSIFIDLDDTVWAFSDNSHDTFKQMYDKFDYSRFFSSFNHFYSLYSERNRELWVDYGQGKITKDELNKERFSHPLRVVGVGDDNLPALFSESFFEEIALKDKLMPNCREALEYLYTKYDLYILSNGFHGLQQKKIDSSAVSKYFKRIILSEDAGVHKPYKEIFDYALVQTGSQAETSIMIGDNWENDILGAHDAGLSQGFYNINSSVNMSFNPTFIFHDWLEISEFL